MELRPTDKWWCLVAFSLIIAGVIPIFTYPLVFDLLLSLSPNSLLFKIWRELPMEVPTDFYFFNWTNPEDIYNKSVKPRFQEIGPYRFWQTEIKENVTWNENGTITFQQRKIWKFDPSHANVSLDDNVTTINVVAVMAAHMTRNWGGFFRRGMFFGLSRALGKIQMTHKVGDLIFEGYKEPLLKLASSSPLFSHFNLPEWDKFGYFYTRNDSTEYDGVLNMDRTTELLGKPYTYNYENKTHYYDGDCSKVAGSFGQFFPRNPPKNFIEVFFLETHTTNPITYVGNETINGLMGYKYISEERMLDNGTKYPENRCFCNGECVPSGLLNFSSIKYGMPVFGSLPHFHRADPYYLERIEGLKPQPEKHEFSFTIEPNTGIPLKVDIGIQGNLLVQPIPGTRLFDDAPRLFFPVFWLRQRMDMKGLMAFLIKFILAVPAICICMGISMMATGIFILIRISRKWYKLKSNRKKMNREQIVPLKNDYVVR